MAARKNQQRDESPSEDVVRNWPNRQEASRILGKSVLTVVRMQRRGELNPVMIEKTWRYDPEELKALEATVDEMDPAALVAAAAESYQQVSKHNAELHETVLRMSEREHATHELLATENDRLRKRIEFLESKYVEMIDAYSIMMQNVHDREVDRMRVEASEKRKERAVEMFVKLAPAAVTGWMRNRVGSELADVVTSIADDEFEAICQSGVISPDKVAVLRKVRQSLKEENTDAHHPTERGDVPPVPAEQG